MLEHLPDEAVSTIDTKGNPMRSILLWAVGLPIPLIIILWLITGHA